MRPEEGREDEAPALAPGRGPRQGPRCAAYRNAYLCLALEAEALEVEPAHPPDAWYDGQNLKKRIAREGPEDWRALLNELPG